MVNWPQTLIKEIAARRCIFFLGAGVSSSSQTSDGLSPKTWKSFLDNASELVSDVAKKETIKKLIADGKLLLALQAVCSTVDPSEYRHFLDENFNNKLYQPSKLHHIIYNLDQRLAITTNFDKIYETYCYSIAKDGFKIIPYDFESLVDEIRLENRLIIKAHGSIDNINKMIFTKSQYHKAKREYSRFYEVLKALFITNTVIFIGCSLDDPDVQLILEDVNIISSTQKPHYIVVKENSQNLFGLNDWKETYNIRALEYGPTHNDLIIDLENLLESVENIRSNQLSL